MHFVKKPKRSTSHEKEAVLAWQPTPDTPHTCGTEVTRPQGEFHMQKCQWLHLITSHSPIHFNYWVEMALAWLLRAWAVWTWIKGQ